MPRSAVDSPKEASNDRVSIRSFHHSAYPAARIAAARAERGLGVSVCLPARECADTVGEIVRVLQGLREAGVVDQIVVVDADSADGTAIVAGRAGAVVCQEAELLPAYGPVLGKGDAMWRALSVLEGELVCFLDADTQRFSEHFVTGLLGPLVCEPGVSFVKAFYRRPLDGGAGPEMHDGNPGTHPDAPDAAPGAPDTQPGSPDTQPDAPGVAGGGRVNHLLARPALELFYPQLVSVRQPLAGEVAAPRELLERLPFATGYGVEIAMLIDAWREVGLEGIAQVDLEEHRNRHQPLSALTPMAFTVLATIARRLEREGRLRDAQAGPVERPPLQSVSVA
jgi:glucosyl-3-phosphoglycerate synthase